VASNLANADTPQYKAMDLDFKRVLENTVKAGSVIRLARTDATHLDGGGLSGGGSIITTKDSENTRVDGNTVNMDQEMLKSAEIQLMYELAVTFLSKKGALVTLAATDPGL
jgi:flagellar basal-body rod protein FlgB